MKHPMYRKGMPLTIWSEDSLSDFLYDVMFPWLGCSAGADSIFRDSFNSCDASSLEESSSGGLT